MLNSEENEDKEGYIDDHANETEQTPLIWGAMGGAFEVCVYLMERGANVQHEDKWGFNAMFHAVQNGEVLLTHMLADKGGDLEARDREGHTLLHWAVYKERAKMASYLLNRGVAVNAADNNGATALHWAAIRGKGQTQ